MHVFTYYYIAATASFCERLYAPSGRVSDLFSAKGHHVRKVAGLIPSQFWGLKVLLPHLPQTAECASLTRGAWSGDGDPPNDKMLPAVGLP